MILTLLFELNRFAFDIAADILVYTIALFIFVQDMDDAKEMGPENAMDFTVSQLLSNSIKT